VNVKKTDESKDEEMLILMCTSKQAMMIFNEQRVDK